MQNCQGNGRPDSEYEKWRWKPSECELPRFDAKKFLELMRGKTLAFIGDSVARNQMESMLCLLWQASIVHIFAPFEIVGLRLWQDLPSFIQQYLHHKFIIYAFDEASHLLVEFLVPWIFELVLLI